MRHGARFVIVAVLLLAGAVLTTTSAPADGGAATSPNLKVAFFGDQSIGASSEAVLDLVVAEGADMVIHLGDLGYGNETDPQRAIDWDAQITSALGADFPYFGTAGNHDVGNWAIYQQLLEDRLALVPGASCSGDYGVMAACTYQGLFFILSGAGTIPNTANHQPSIDYIEDQLALDDSVWRVCAWHKNQNAMQVGNKANEVGWGPYEACREGRAIVATGHEHSYSRTKTLSSIQNQTIDPGWTDPNLVRVAEDSTFVFVSGLGGRSIRHQVRCLPATAPYGCNGEWASISTSTQGANYGALFITFHVDGDPNKATGYYKEIDGDVIDTFTLVSQPKPEDEPEVPVPVGGIGMDVASGAVVEAAGSSRAPIEEGRSPGANTIAGGAIAGVVTLAAFATLFWRRRRSSWRGSV